MTMALAIAIALAMTMTALGATMTMSPAAAWSAAASATGEIAGVIVHGGSPDVPVPRGVVSLTGPALAAPRSAIADDSGRFVFRAVPAGTFMLTVRKAAYLDTSFGSVRPGQPGTPVVLADGERRALSVTMFKGAVIAGVVRDAGGRASGAVPVHAVNIRENSLGLAALIDTPAITDDRGAYRIYGLPPGDYVVAALPPGAAGAPEVTTRSTAEMDALLAPLAQGRVRADGTVVSLPLGSRSGFAPVYFPGTPRHQDAAVVRVAAGEVRDAVDIVAAPVRVASIAGTVSGGAGPLTNVELGLLGTGPRFPGASLTPTQTPLDASGAFSFGNLAPGTYRVLARARSGPADPNAAAPGRASGGGASGVRPAGMTLPTNAAYLYAVADIDVDGRDVTGVGLSLRPGGHITGRVVVDAASPLPAADLSAMRMQALAIPGADGRPTTLVTGASVLSVPGAGVGADGTFQLLGLGPTHYRLSVQLPAHLRAEWFVRSAIAAGRDLLDEEIAGLDAQHNDVTLTVSNRRTSLSGRLESTTGQPAAQYFVVVFPTNERYWRTSARRHLTTRPDTAGGFSFPELPAGEYFIAALTDLDPAAWQEPAYLRELASAAVTVTVAWGEQRTQHLRIR